MAAPTIYDVARLAGVSHQTVTRYLQGFEGIRPSTRQRVEDALSELNYRPNVAARFLRNGTTNRIVVFAESIDLSGPARIVKGASELARERGYFLDIVVVDGTEPDSVSESLDLLTSQPVAGVLAAVKTEVVLTQVKRHSSRIPLVTEAQIGAGETGPTFSELAGRVAADHLLDLGHRDIGYLAGPAANLASQERLNGFTQRVLERGGNIQWVRHGDWTPESGADAWSALPPAERGVTAIAAANDSMAIGVISRANATGVSVPGQLSVIGTDDLPEARFMMPSVSTVVLDFEGEGRALLAALLAIIEGSPEPQTVRMSEPRVIPRASTARVQIDS